MTDVWKYCHNWGGSFKFGKITKHHNCLFLFNIWCLQRIAVHVQVVFALLINTQASYTNLDDLRQLQSHISVHSMLNRGTSNLCHNICPEGVL